MRKGILLLNASFEPLCVVTLKRATLLVIQDKAVVVATTDKELRSARASMKVPSVIRLVHYVRVPYRTKVPLSRNALLARDNYTCQYCFKPGDTIDHVIPKAKGGKHAWDNVVIACKKCNGKKSDKLLSDLGWKLPVTPKAPSSTHYLLIGVAKLDESWEPFLAPQLQAV